jgi:hypothetical protein
MNLNHSYLPGIVHFSSYQSNIQWYIMVANNERYHEAMHLKWHDQLMFTDHEKLEVRPTCCVTRMIELNVCNCFAWNCHTWSVSPVFVIVFTHLQVSPVFPISPRCIYPCVSCFSVPVRLVLPSQPAIFLALIFPNLWFFLALLVFTLACRDSESARLTTLPVLTSSLPIPLNFFGLWPGLWTLACPRPAFCRPL